MARERERRDERRSREGPAEAPRDERAQEAERERDGDRVRGAAMSGRAHVGRAEGDADDVEVGQRRQGREREQRGCRGARAW